jgi:hypothetical protein
MVFSLRASDMHFIIIPTIYDALHPAFGSDCVTYFYAFFFISYQTKPPPCAVSFVA